MPDALALVERIESDPAAVVRTLRALAEDEATDVAQVLVRLRLPGAKTVILGVEPEDYEADDA